MILTDEPEQQCQTLEVETLSPLTNTSELAADVLDSVEFSGSQRQRAIIETRLAKYLQNEAGLGDISPELSAEFSALLNQATEFISRRYDSLNLTIPHKVVLTSLSLQNCPQSASGTGQASSRSIALKIGDACAKVSLIGLMVHEITHAIGHAAIQPRVNEEAPSIVSIGWKLFKRDNQNWAQSSLMGMFEVFEEAVAYNNERLLCFEHGLTSQQSECTVKFSPTNDHNFIKIAAISHELETSEEMLEELVSEGLRGQEFVSKINSDGFTDTLDHERLVGEGISIQSKYKALPSALSLLAKELYPSDPSPYDSLMDDLTTAQVTGERKPFLMRLKETFGPDSIKFFALLQTNDTATTTHTDTTLLSLYARAGALGKERAEVIRNTLTNILFESRGSHLNWSTQHQNE